MKIIKKGDQLKLQLNYSALKNCFKNSSNKKIYNQELFTLIAPKYNIATRALSLFQDQSWKKKLINQLPSIENPICLDLACGTGDVTFALAKKYQNGKINGLDLTPQMINIAKQLNTYNNVEFNIGDMCSINFDDNSCDIITGSYAFRNSPDLNKALTESYRVLKPGGHLAILDFAKFDNKIAQKTQYYLLKVWGSFLGLIFHANPTIYEYIAHSLQNHPANNDFANLIKQNNFKILSNQKLFFGMMQILHLKK